MRTIILGAAHIDRIGYASSAAAATSAPGRVHVGFGGVAYNIAVGLAALGEDVELVTAIGSDSDGQTLLQDLVSRSIGTSCVSVVPDRATATYHAIINRDGMLLGAVADMEIYEQLTSDHLIRFAPQIVDAGLVFVDANLPLETLRWIAGLDRSGILVANTVSTAKAVRLLPILDRLDLLFTNRDEALALVAGTPASAMNADTCAVTLCELGVMAAIVSCGAGPISVGRRSREVCALSVPAAIPVDETGAGDALVAGTVFGLLKEQDLLEALTVGLVAARICIESAGSGLPPDRIGEITTALNTTAPKR